MRIGSDLDNVIVNILESARAVVANDLNIPIGEIRDTFLYWNPFTHDDPTVAARIQLDHAFWNRPDVLGDSAPVEGSLEAAWRLFDAGLLNCYITRRAPEAAEVTRSWLSDHRFPNLPIEHVGTVASETYYATCKSIACARHGVTHMIDDHAHEAEALMRAGVEVVVVDAPIARIERHEFIGRHPHIRMVGTMSEAAEVLLSEHGGGL